MIFIGGGSLLSRAVGSAVGSDLKVDLVCCPEGDTALPSLRRMGVPVLQSNAPSSDLLLSDALRRVDVAFSINNKYILSDALLASGARFYNIHNGLTQRYRGIAEVCIFAALCNAESSYGVTMHRLLPGQKVDMGPVVTQLTFPVAPEDSFEIVMTRSLAACNRIFVEQLRPIVRETQVEREVGYQGTAFAYKNVPAIVATARPERLALARRLGVFETFFPRLAALVAATAERGC